jgi:hypothetical protein
MPTRLAFVYISKTISLQYLPVLGYLALLPAIGFIYLYLSGTRKTGPETFGDTIWWDHLRPIHALFYLLFAYNAINKVKTAWVYLMYDVILGLFSFLFFHFVQSEKKN